jgi:hypothetical protein
MARARPLVGFALCDDENRIAMVIPYGRRRKPTRHPRDEEIDDGTR